MITNKFKNLNKWFKNDNIVTISELTNNEFELLKNMANLGVITNIDNRVFVPNDYTPNDYLIRQLVLQNGIYCNQSALYLWNLTDSFNFDITMAFRQGYILPKSRFQRWTNDLKVKQIRTPLLNQDIEQISVDGTKKKITLYNRERTLIDILNKKSLIDNEEISNAYKKYLNSTNKNMNKLLTIAQRMNKEEKVRNILGVVI
ncbi:hypothetical protein M5C72_00890 [Companilactobacillus allii]|uniref:Abortive infection protein AbiGI n=1 Tax=Companilactobacillus allii TaxID=1847728 RepID=A0A1P8Q1M9_9LACO|nr:hypothetical protein [Companilactobacillus allii]APX71735.1 hypothetical protein BTM29_03825 [Companilactobacillus allii]USQ68822.1 hypothetical protein M5C72_00890 [Companilactobacillus allii]